MSTLEDTSNNGYNSQTSRSLNIVYTSVAAWLMSKYMEPWSSNLLDSTLRNMASQLAAIVGGHRGQCLTVKLDGIFFRFLFILYTLVFPPSQDAIVTTLFLVGDPNLNLPLPLESWEGGQPNVHPKRLTCTTRYSHGWKEHPSIRTHFQICPYFSTSSNMLAANDDMYTETLR